MQLMVDKPKEQDIKEPLRVAQVIGKMWAGGVETVIFNYYREIDHKKVQFDFYYDADSTVAVPQELIDMGARFIKVPPYQDLRNYIKVLVTYFKKNQYVIVHSHINTLSIFPLFAASVARVPIRIAHNHSVPGGNEWKKNLLKNGLRIFSKCFSTDYFACSEKAGRWLFGNNCFDKQKVIIIRNAVDYDKFSIDEDTKNQLLNRWDLNNRFVVGHVGRFTFAKNHELLLEIFHEIHKIRKDAVLLLVGDGELHSEIKNKIQSLDISDYVRMTGKVREAEKYYSLMNVLLLPSIFEGLSLTAIEAQIAKLPIVISKAVPKEAIISNACQYMDLKDSPKSWAEQAIKIAQKEVRLNKWSKDYNIKRNAPKLTQWYLNRTKEI